MSFIVEPIVSLFKKPDMTQLNKSAQESAELAKEMKKSLEETNKSTEMAIASMSQTFASLGPSLSSMLGSPPGLGAISSSDSATAFQNPEPWKSSTVLRPPFPPIG